jgi:Ca2+:H+ antiporter
MPRYLKPRLDWLLVLVPVVVGLEFLRPDAHVAIFFTACAAIIPLAGWLGRATEHLAERTGEGVGGLLNATFGNAAEMIIAFMALRQGLTEVVKASLTGSIIGNILLVLGAAFLTGGLRHPEQEFNEQGARTQATLLWLCGVALITPAAFHLLGGPGALPREVPLSTVIAVLLLVAYGLGLLFSLRTHKHLFAGHRAEAVAVDGARAHTPWTLRRSLTVLLAATAAIAWVSEILVGSVEETAEHLGMTDVFIGVIVVAVIGNAAEHSSAILMAARNRMDLALGIAVGSSIQIALFVAPVLVLISYLVAPSPMDLVFTGAEVLAVGLAVAITAQIAGDGRSNWLEGVLLLTVYLILGVVFFYLPAGTM